jgi:formylglycine-generating enzyme required for sulfatase activity
MSNAAVLAAMAAKHKGTLAADCIAARLEQLKQIEAKKTAAPKETPEAQKLSPTRAPVPLTDAEEHGLRPKDRFKECSECPEMVVVPAGSFTMGSPPGEKGRKDDEAQRQYTFVRPFAVGRFEVTQAEWAACYDDKRCDAFFKRGEKGRRPAFVSWERATTYATWLSGKTGKEYRLLSEAEWEYAARAGTTTRYAFGNAITERQAKFSADGSWQVPFILRPFTWDDVEVGSFRPNAWGLHDMHGNVWEWCSDVQVIDGSRHGMLRGGSWNSPPEDLRSARRRWELSLKDDKDMGFRVARTL